ncbi:MAG: DUF4347 domain-containing protein [Drouetiella hepatica Uher 2000/2452]|jgi:Ca2+-binding RTX toxin-like protein|uniref:DUF4347 domain-containing protein n=1 Tax=Drouetiella hepatica Uher 2000/2452 TaxID=904376 RepID=A0A951QBS6_9CYAN|nr:DUF4347 domain-containing protein [Drouetiella hepatica Uher 2000/2452]
MTSTFSCTTLLVVDPTVSDYQILVDGASPQTQVAVLNPGQEGVAQISAILSQYSGIKSLHILSHGAAGQLRLGSSLLNWQTFERYAIEIQNWAAALVEGADILLYGCQVGAGAIGQSFVRQLSQLTQANIAASANLTGHSALGGDWQLEFTTGQISSPLVFEAEAIAAYSGVLAITINETFSLADVTETPWLFGVDASATGQDQPYLTARPTQAASANGLQGNPPGSTPDPVGNGTLRLTTTRTDQAAFVVYNSPISATGGLQITFDFFSYGGTGADGITFFLIDGAANPTAGGAFGGSIGYANRSTPIAVPGIAGGYLGIALDEFGNFSNPSEGRIGGPGQTPDSVSVRGSQANGYQYLTGTGTLPFSIDNPGAGATRENSKRTAQIDLTAAGVLTVQVDGNGDGDFVDAGEQAITNFNVAAVNGALPTSFKFGFASGTGNQTNIHEIRNLVIDSNLLPNAIDASVQVERGATVNLTGLSAVDTDGTIVSYTLSTLPTAASGTLFLGNPATGGTAVTAGQILQPGQITQLFFQATSTFTSGSFTYTATDNRGGTDLIPAIVSLARPGAVNQLPVAQDASVEQIEANTPKQVTGVIATDPDGTIASYTLLTLPKAASGTLFLGNPTAGGTLVRAGQQLTPAQVNQLFFRATDAFSLDTFTYTATDNAGASDLTPATVTLRGIRNDPAPVDGCVTGRTMPGHAPSENLIGGNRANRIIGFAGDDRIKGRGCGDRIDAGLGSDWVSGGDANDTIKGQQSNDRLLGDKGNDNLSGGLGSDSLYGGRGSDTIGGGRGNDSIYGSTGNNTIKGGLSNDTLYGGRDQDLLNGNSSNDVLLGGNGNDTLQGGLGSDQLNGGNGDDILSGARGNDTLKGGKGRDQFVYNATTDAIDTIADFQVGQDKIVVKSLFSKSGYGSNSPFRTYIKLVQSGSNAIVSIDGNGDRAGGFLNLVTVLGVSSTSLTASSFVV